MFKSGQSNKSKSNSSYKGNKKQGFQSKSNGGYTPKPHHDKGNQIKTRYQEKENKGKVSAPYGSKTLASSKQEIRKPSTSHTTKNKMAMNKFVKVSVNDFKSGCLNLMKVLPAEVSELFSGVNPSPEAITKRIAELALEKTPNFTSRENILWEFKIAANKTSVKTDKYCTFGWWVKYHNHKDKEQKDVQYYFFVSIYDSDFKLEKTLKENGYSLFATK